jgi:DNA-directed RNA polymerase specialized sigma24 family protein
MQTTNAKASSTVPILSDDERWTELYNRLRPLAKTWSYRAGVATWKGQENDIAEDIVQAALLKVFQYSKSCRENGTAIGSLEHLSLVIAKHCFLDMRRRELRFQRLSNAPDAPCTQLSLERLIDPSQEAEERIYEEWLLATSAKTITAFSTKLRAAILADLANNSCFDTEPSALQQAFLAAGVRLQDYQHAPSQDPAERGRQSALRSLAYKRVSQAHIS